MSSSTSSSDPARDWGRCLRASIGSLAVGASLVLALMLAVDPYDSGRFGWFSIKGVNDRNATTANVSRARDPQFNAAIFGNSTGQLLAPVELSRATGLQFVQLVAPGADPRGQLAILDFFVRHHPRIGALVFVLDDLWCSTSLPPLPRSAFPFWLYGESALAYLDHLFTWKALDRAFQRIDIGLGRRAPMNADGFWSYEEVWPPEKRPEEGPKRPSPPSGGRSDHAFPFAGLLRAAIGKLPADVPVVLLSPPTFHRLVPEPGTRDATDLAACYAAYKSIVAGRPHSNFIDYRIDNALTRDPRNFVDMIHYRAGVARRLEQGVAASIRSGASARIEF
jgi:hypothetical protein